MVEKVNLCPTQYPGYYVSDCGRVFRDPNKKIPCEKNLSEPLEVSQWLRGGARTKQYKAVNISLRNSEGKTLRQKKVYVHRLVAETFLDNPHNYSEVDHINRDKLCNRVDNLRWCDRLMNQHNGALLKGEDGRFISQNL